MHIRALKTPLTVLLAGMVWAAVALQAKSLDEMHGKGVEKHRGEALKWCRLASAQGHQIAELHQATLTRDDIIQAVRLSQEWKPVR